MPPFTENQPGETAVIARQALSEVRMHDHAGCPCTPWRPALRSYRQRRPPISPRGELANGVSLSKAMGLTARPVARQRPREAVSVLVDCKVHGVGGLARRATATTIWTAWGTAPRVGYRDRHRAGIGDVCSCDRGGELLCRDVGCRSRRTVPIHHRVVVEAAAVNGQGES